MKKQKNIKKKEFIAYIIEDKHFGELRVKKSANAWWMHRGKVESLIQGFKMDCRVRECLVLAGITEDQLKYFREKHPEFSTVLEALRSVTITQARLSLIRDMQKDGHLALKYLERKAPDEFKEKKEIEIEKPSLVQNMFPLDDDY